MERQVRMFGAETEYAVAAMRGGAAVDRELVLHAMMQAARRRLVHLPDLGSGGMFLENGSRFYVDCGMHPEVSSPECTDPWTLVSYVQAGNRIVADLVLAVETGELIGTEVMCFRCNVDYSGTDSTWGSHESYLHCIDPESLQPLVVPHIVSRIVYTGAGGFNPRSPGLEFSLSPRVAHFNQVASSDSTSHDRAIYHTKNEPLCGDGFNRLHIICGETLCSETAMLLKVGTTALIVAMADNGMNPGAEVQLESPLEALRTFAADPTCKKTVRMKDGRRLTAIEVQRHYLEKAEALIAESFMPEWAAEVCRIWRDVLDRLADDPRSTDRILDWPLKLSLYTDQAARLGIRWDRLTFWAEILNRLNNALERAKCIDTELPLDFVIGPQSPVPDEANRLSRFLRLKGLGWEELQRLMDTRPRFFEIDTRFGQLGDKGIFQSLDAAGVLHHRTRQHEDAPSAISEPPAAGRALVRGRAIRRLAAERGDWYCDWGYITNTTDGRTLDLSNPFATEEIWRDPVEQDADQRSGRIHLLSRLETLLRRA